MSTFRAATPPDLGVPDRMVIPPCGHGIAFSDGAPPGGLAAAVLEHQSRCSGAPEPPIPFPEPRPIGEDPLEFRTPDFAAAP